MMMPSSTFPIRGGGTLAALASAAAAALLLGDACAPDPTRPSTPPVTGRTAPPIVISAQPARRGDIQEALTYSGDVRAKSQISILPKASGRVERILVDAGSRVEAGDMLAKLERDSAEVQLLQARAVLAGAEARLAQVQVGGPAEDVAAAKAAYDAAQARLDQMLRGGRDEVVAQAQAQLDAANAVLQQLQRGATDDVMQAVRSAVDADQAAVAAAEAALANQRVSSPADLQQAQSQVETLKGQLTAAQAAADNVRTIVGAAIAQRDAAKAALDQAFAPTDTQILEAEKDVRNAQASLTAVENGAYGTTCFDSPTSPRNGAACDAAKDAARKALDLAESRLALLNKGGTPAEQADVTSKVAQAEAGIKNAATQRVNLDAGVVQARENLKVAQARLDALLKAGLDLSAKKAQADLTAARERLKADQARLDQLLKGPSDEDLQQAQAQVAIAGQQLALAQRPFTDNDVRAQRALGEQARQQVLKAQKPYTEQDLQAAQAAVDQARAQLELAELGLKETQVVAPVGGVIAERLVAPGALVSASTPIVTLVPPDLEIVVNVEEAQLGQVADGQSVILQVAAFPDRTFTGVVKAVSPTVDARSRTATVRIEPKDDGGKLKPGMFARLSITVASKQDALLVPREALLSGAPGGRGSVGAALRPRGTVMVIEAGTNRVREVPVDLGLADGRRIEVLVGLDEGQIVATSGLADLADGDVVAPRVEDAITAVTAVTAGLSAETLESWR